MGLLYNTHNTLYPHFAQLGGIIYSRTFFKKEDLDSYVDVTGIHLVSSGHGTSGSHCTMHNINKYTITTYLQEAKFFLSDIVEKPRAGLLGR